MSDADWPAPEPTAPREPAQRSSPLPRVEDLPIAEQGYDRESVREAFDAFYRHAAQLDATLRTLESVEVFQRTAAELRAELRTIRGSGWTVQSWQGRSYAARQQASEWTLPPSFPRVAAEAIFLIVIGVVVGVAGWSRLTIVAVMGAALAVVWLIEWVAARERAIPRASAPAAVPVLDDEPAELPAAEGVAVAEEGPEALTILDTPPVVVQDEAAPAELEPEEEPEPEAELEERAEPEPEPVDEPVQPELPEEPVVEDTFEEVVAVAEAEEIEAVAEELEPSPDLAATPPPVAGIAEVEEPQPEQRRFRLFRRSMPEDSHEPTPAAELSAQIAAPSAQLDDEPTDEDVSVTVPNDPGERVGALDPWEQEPAVPLAPEAPVPAHEEEPEPFTPPDPSEPFVDPETPSPFVEPDQPGPFEAPEAPPFWQPPEGDAEEPPDEAAAAHDELDPERDELPAEALAEQAAAALERSRARRRAPRRARRR